MEILHLIPFSGLHCPNCGRNITEYHPDDVWTADLKEFKHSNSKGAVLCTGPYTPQKTSQLLYGVTYKDGEVPCDVAAIPLLEPVESYVTAHGRVERNGKSLLYKDFRVYMEVK